MRTINIDVSSFPSSSTIMIGKQGENNATQIVFDLSSFVDLFGDGSATLVFHRGPDAAPYLVPAVHTGRSLVWTVTDTDTQYDGLGAAEVRWTVNDVLAKSAVFRTMCNESITGNDPMPPAMQSWYDAMIDYINDLYSFEDTGDGNVVISKITDSDGDDGNIDG